LTDTASAGHPVTGAALSTEIVREQAAFDALAEDWAALHAASPTATAFQSHAWLAAWARGYCRPGRLRVVLVRAGGRLVAAAPLHLVRRGPWPVLAPLGGALSDFTDVLVAAEVPTALDALVRALVDEPGWRLVDLPEVRPGAAAGELAHRWPARVDRLEASVCLELPALPLPELLATMPAKAGRRVRNHMRKIDAVGVDVETARPEAVPDAVTDLLRLHEEQWRGRGVTPEHLRPRFAAFLREALPRMVADRQALVVRYRTDGRLVASELVMAGSGLMGSYIAGVDPQLRSRMDVAGMLVRANLGFAVAAGVPTFSFLRGDEPYKSQWHPERVRNVRLLLGRPGLPGAAGLPALLRFRAASVRAARQRAPWLRTVRDRLTTRRPA
jgi:CelD/BcsL family acetyltransferase involved in cellulose biosynthesis